MRGNRALDTKPEAEVRRLLHRQGLRFFKHRQVVPGFRCRPDLVFPTERVAVFIDGCFWHSCPEHGHQPKANSEYWNPKLERNRIRDRRNDSVLHQHGWLVLRAWEHEPSAAVAARVTQSVMRRRKPGR